VADALGLPGATIGADKLEASLAYTRFHGISKRSNALVNVVRRRLEALGGTSVAAPAYEELLALCRNTYCGARESLLTGSVRNHMDILRERHGLVGMTRLASVFLIRLCTVETALYLDFFGSAEKKHLARKSSKVGPGKEGEEKEKSESDKAEEDKDNNGPGNNFKRKGSTASYPSAATLASQVLSEDATYKDAEFQSMLGSLCSALHRTIRRGLVSVLDLDVLCQVVSVLREERSAANSSPTTLAAARAVSGVIQDAQERLIYCANTAMHKEVVRFKPTAADLNYPGKLLGEKPKPAIIIDDEDGENKAEGAQPAATDSANEEKTPEVTDAVAAQLRVYESWFPPMRSVLRILSKIFRVVEPRVFEDIALQSVQACTKSLKDGSVHILAKSGQIHADLFLVKHLLILREQLSPFDIQLRSVERQLDFSEAGKAVSRFLANRNRRLFSMSTENALITLLREGVSVQESSVDSKRDLEDCLRSACNDFIEHTSTSLLGPISSLVDKCKNAIGSGTGSTDALSKAPFMNGAVVKGVFSTSTSAFDGELENVSKQMNLYLENTATQNILLKPVVRKMTRALEDAKRFIGDVPDDENGWDAELRSEVVQMIENFEAKVKVVTSKHGAR
jgi:small nuclear ribonucleoprotein (snRNP)-like protein